MLSFMKSHFFNIKDIFFKKKLFELLYNIFWKKYIVVSIILLNNI